MTYINFANRLDCICNTIMQVCTKKNFLNFTGNRDHIYFIY